MSTRILDIGEWLNKRKGGTTDWLLWGLDNMIWPIVALTFVVFAILIPEVFASTSKD